MKTRIRKSLMSAVGVTLAAGMFFGSGAADAATKLPTLHLATPVASSHGMMLRWSGVKHASKYKIAYSLSNRFTHRRTVSTAGEHVTVAHLTNGLKYYVQVFALHGAHRIAVSPVRNVTPHASVVAPAPQPKPTHATLASALTGVPAGGTAMLQAGAYTFNDFAAGEGSTAGYDVPASVGKIEGAGESRSIISMTPHSSTKGNAVPVAAYTTNQFSLLVTHGTNLSDLTLQGTDQGHLYNGLRVHRANNTHVTNVKVAAVPGNKNYPPGETFGINDYRTNGSVYNNIEVDGNGVGAAGFGGNDSEDISITNAYFHDNPYSAGITFWQSSNITLTDVRSENNHGGFNFERDAGTINIVRPVWGNLGNKHAFAFDSDQASAKVNIYDPVLPAGTSKFFILVAPTYLGVANKQLKSDIHVYVHGKDVTSSLVTFAG